MKELYNILIMLVVFIAAYYVPFESLRIQNSVSESLFMLQSYAREHVLLCLVPAFFIAGAIANFVSQQSVIKYFGAKANKLLSYSIASISGAILAVCSCTVLPLFAGIYKNDTIYGRGATDQKLSMASMVYAGKIIKDLKLEGDYTLMVVGSVMEEDCDGLPLLHLINKEKLRPDFVVITEPTDLKVYRGHRGRMEMKVVTKGRSCHASAPERGDNAVVKMSDIVKEITALNKKLKVDKFIGKGTVAVTCIECKTPSLNAVPDECTIYLDRRLTIGETLKSSVAEIQRLPSVKKYGGKVEVLQYDAVAWTGAKVSQEKYFPTWVLSAEHKLVKAGVEAGKVALGKTPVVDKWVFSTNGVATAGRLNIPTIGFGPGNEVYAHTVNEFMPAEDLVKAAAFYAAIPQYL